MSSASLSRIWLSGKYRAISPQESGALVFGLEVERWTPSGAVVDLFACEVSGEAASRLSSYAKDGTRLELTGALRPTCKRVLVHELRPIFKS